MRRAAVYAGMSADRQSADSPADARCRDYADREGLRVVLVHLWSSETSRANIIQGRAHYET
jgi:hypothetical protein